MNMRLLTILGILFVTVCVHAGVNDNLLEEDEKGNLLESKVLDAGLNNALFKAAKEGNLSLVKSLICDGASVEIKNGRGETPLHCSIKKGDLKLVKFLIDNGADINAKDCGQRTPLHQAALYGRLAIARFLVENGADINVKCNIGGTAQELAESRTRNNQYGKDCKLVAKYLKEMKAKAPRKYKVITLTKPVGDVTRKLFKAVIVGNLALIKDLVKSGADINAKDKYGWTPLHSAAFKGKLKIVKWLLHNGANINAKNKDGKTALELAESRSKSYYNKECELVAKYIKSFNVHKTTPSKARLNKALHLALSSTNLSRMKILLKKGADINAKDEYGWTVFNKAVSLNLHSFISYLAKQGADINTPNNMGWTPLHWATFNKDPKVVKFLVKRSADINARKNDGWTPLHIATLYNMLDMVKFFLKNGADVSIKTENGDTAQELAMDNGHAAIALHLKNAIKIPIDNPIKTGEKKPVQVALQSDVDLNIPFGESPYRKDSIAVIIGNRDYRKGIPAVEYAHNDAQAVKKYMIKTFNVDNQRIIYKENAMFVDMLGIFGNKDNHKGSLYAKVLRYRPKVVYIYYSGHGLPGLTDKNGYLAPCDVVINSAEITGFPLEVFYKNLSILKSVGVERIVVMLDSCFSGESQNGRLVRQLSPIVVTAKNPLSASKVGLILCATGGKDYASWFPEKSHGMFTYFLLKGLGGKADQNMDKNISVGEMRTYLERHVPGTSLDINKVEQTPQVIGKNTEVILRLK